MKVQPATKSIYIIEPKRMTQNRRSKSTGQLALSWTMSRNSMKTSSYYLGLITSSHSQRLSAVSRNIKCSSIGKNTSFLD